MTGSTKLSTTSSHTTKGKQVLAPDLKQLHGKYRGLLRLRTGSWRIIFKMEADRLVVLVFDVVKRGNAYR